MERARVAAAVVSAVLVAARVGLGRRRTDPTPVPDTAPAPAVGSAPAPAAEGSSPLARGTEAAPGMGRGAAPRLIGGLDRWLAIAGLVGLVVTLGLVVRNVFGWPAPRPAGGGTDWALVGALLTLAVWVVYLFWKVPEWQAASRVGGAGSGRGSCSRSRTRRGGRWGRS